MSFSKKITLSLFLAGANAQATIQPRLAAGTTTNLKYSTSLYTIASEATGGNAGDYTAIQTSKKAVATITDSASTEYNTGLYGCIMSELTPMATQGFDHAATANTNTVVGDQQADARTFWGNIAAHQGTFALTGTMDTAADIDGNSFFDCCTADQLTIDDADTYNQCPTLSSLSLDATPAVDLSGSILIPDRIIFSKDGYSVLIEQNDGTAKGDVGMEWNSDFLLASQAQLNAVDDSTTGFCSGTWENTMTTDSAIELEALADFNSNTKCSWQVTAKTGSAPQFKLLESPTSQILVHFVEWADKSTTTFATSDILPAADTALDLKVGAYDPADGVFFNPFVNNVLEATSSTMMFGTTANQAFTEVARSNSNADATYYPGAPLGSWNVYAVASSPFDAANTKIDSASNAGFYAGVQAALNQAADIYTEWESLMDDYNDEVADYNDDVQAYNDALADGEDELPEVPDRPCPPGDIEDISDVQPYYNDDSTAFDVADYETKNIIAEYVPADSSANNEVDSWAYGFLLSAADENSSGDYSDEYDTAMSVGKVFGRFGQGAQNMPDEIAPLRLVDSDDTAGYTQSMMISVFPTLGTTWNGSAALASDLICVEVSGASLTWSDIFTVPSASGSADDADDMDFAKVLGASAMVMAASIAALY